MKLSINGEQVELPQPCTVAALLAQRDLASTACAVEVNAELVPRRKHVDVVLNDGDRVEIVTLVGGG